MKALILDTETNGLFRYDRRADQEGQPRMASIAAVLVNGSEVIGQFYRLIKPLGWEAAPIAHCKAGTEAFAINKLSWERLNDEGVAPEIALAEYDAFVDECEGIAAYGVTFDQKVVRAEQRRAGRPDRYGERPTFCVMQAARPLCNLKKAPKLAEAVQILLKRDLAGAHDAKVDLQATHELYALMLGMPRVVEFKPQVSKLQENET